MSSKPKLALVGQDGNAFVILGRAISVARKAKWTQEEIDAFLKEAKSGDYDNLLRTCMKYFNCDEDEEDDGYDDIGDDEEDNEDN
jgi:hypothetical protein